MADTAVIRGNDDHHAGDEHHASGDVWRDDDPIHRLVAENVHELIRVFDLGGRCVYATPSVARRLGRASSTLFEHAHPEDVETGRRWWTRVWAGADDALEWRTRDASGNWAWLETRATRVQYRGQPHLLTCCRDISERERATQGLREHESVLRNLVESTPGVMAVYHVRPDGSSHFPFTSSRLWDVYGLRPEDVADDAEPLLSRTHPDDVARLRETMEASARNKTLWRLEYRIVHPTRGEVWLEGYANPEAHPDGGTTWYGFLHDVSERKRAEQAAKASEERMRLAFSAAKIGTGELVLETQQAILSDALQQLLGFVPGTFNPNLEECIERVHPEDQALVRRALDQTVATGEDTTVDCRVVWPDGSVHWVTSLTKAFYDETGKPTRMVGALVDITERKRTEDELRRTAGLLRSVIEGTTDAVFVKDRAGRYVLCNAAAAQALGRSVAEVLGNDDTAVFDAPSARIVREHDRRVMERGVAETEEEDLSIGGNSFTYFATKAPYRDEHGNVIGVIGVARDITTRKQAEAALRRSEALLRRAEAMAHVASWTVNVADGVVQVSHEGRRLFGFGDGLLRLDDLTALAHPDDRPRVEAAVKAALEGKAFEMEYRLLVDGEVRWVQRRVEPELDAQGRVARIIGVSQDITERRHLEEQFRQAQKMEAIGTLAGGVAHDFNNVLTIIGGYCDELLLGIAPGDPRREMVLEIQQASERAVGLTRQLLMFSRQQVVTPQVLDLNTVVAGMQKLLRRVIGEDIVLTAVLGSEGAPVKADVGQLEQVLLNLAVNARDAMPQGGRLTIETRRVTLDAAYAATHAGATPGAHVLLAVSDTGSGLDPETKARIFEPFFTTKGLGRGTGLGLSVVHGVVTQSGGHIDVSSEIGLGTTFQIYLPVAAERSPRGALDDASRVMPRGTETVLLVEDESAVRALARRILQSCGYTVLEAADGREALLVAAGHDGPLHLLVSDVVIPHLGGRQLADRLTSLTPSLKVLFLSGYTDDAVIRHGVVRAQFNFLQKPFTPTELAQKVRAVLDE